MMHRRRLLGQVSSTAPVLHKAPSSPFFSSPAWSARGSSSSSSSSSTAGRRRVASPSAKKPRASKKGSSSSGSGGDGGGSGDGGRSRAAKGTSGLSGGAGGGAGRTPSAADYSRQTPREHVLLRPQMYVGSTEPATARAWAWEGVDDLVSTVESSASGGGGGGSATKATTAAQSSAASSSSGRMVARELTTTPALCKVFDEILVNAADNRARDAATRLIAVDIDPAEPRITVFNDGRGIPVEVHPTEQLYVPELIFGHLLTGSNFDDDAPAGRLTGGRHGYGAKLANILAREFSVETLDPDRGLRYRQTWRDNMQVAEAPVIDEVAKGSRKKGANSGHGYTRISWVPDLARLGGTTAIGSTSTSTSRTSITNSTGAIDGDNLSALCRRVVDVAACLAHSQVKVTLNGHTVPVASFKDFMALFDHANAAAAATTTTSSNSSSSGVFANMAYERSSERWEVGVLPLSSAAAGQRSRAKGATGRGNGSSSGGSMVGVGGFGGVEHVSFVNNMATSRGGSHVSHVASQLVKRLMEHFERKEFADIDVTPALIRSRLLLFVNASIENPAFDSQMKDMLISKPAAFGSSWEPSRKFLAAILQDTTLVEDVVAAARRKGASELNKQLRRGGAAGGGGSQRLNIPKLDDAYLAGCGRAEDLQDCTLILTEGDSAKALAVAGLEVLGREHFGVFPLRGKLLNVREASGAQLRGNKELMALCTILGLSFDKAYEGGPDATMRYGRVMIMTDQDHDGSHIKGLLINFFHHFWPNLLRAPGGFLQQFATPVLKATRLDGPSRKQLDRATKSSAGDGDGNGGNSSSSNGGGGGGGKRRSWAWQEGTAANVARGETVAFYSTLEYERWVKDQRRGSPSKSPRSSGSSGGGGGGAGKWKVKYYKGLGTSTAAEAKEYFRDLERHRSTFTWDDDANTATSSSSSSSSSGADDLIDMVFNKARAEDRREWLLANGREEDDDEHGGDSNHDYMNANEGEDGVDKDGSFASSLDSPSSPSGDGSAVVSYADFVNKELVHFSHADNVRSIPSVMDGLKPSQRKLLFACFKRNGSRGGAAGGALEGPAGEIKVAQLSGYCAEQTAYHHGEASMQSTIVGMAQDFVGSNNVPLLTPSGQFGTRLAGGKDSASPRYIFTYLSKAARRLFPQADDDLLERLEDDGLLVEPRHYVPVLPLLLVNGAQGIGTGWSTSVPPHHPLQLIRLIAKRLIAEEQQEEEHGGEGSSSLSPSSPSAVPSFHDLTAAEPLIPWYRGFRGQVVPDQVDNPYGGDGGGAAAAAAAGSSSGGGGNGSGAAVVRRFVTRGVARVAASASSRSVPSEVEISELPIGRWTGDYKAFLLRLCEDPTASGVVGFREHHTADHPRFVVQMQKKALKELLQRGPTASANGGRGSSAGDLGGAIDDDDDDDDGRGDGDDEGRRLARFFRLETTVAMGNMTAFGPDGRSLKRYSSAADILEDYYPVRLELYAQRKRSMESALARRVAELEERARFIEAVRSRDLDLASGGLSAADVAKRLAELGFVGTTDDAGTADGAAQGGESDPSSSAPMTTTPEDGNDGDGDFAAGDSDSGASSSSSSSSSLVGRYAKLLALPLRSFTAEKIAATREEVAREAAALQELRTQTPCSLWLRDLAHLEQTLRAQEAGGGDGGAIDDLDGDMARDEDADAAAPGSGFVGSNDVHTGLMQFLR